MAFDTERFKERQAKRAELRHKKAAQSKRQRRYILLGTAVALVVGIGTIILSLRGCQSTQKPAETTQPPANTATVHLAAVGDLNINEVIAASEGSDHYAGLFMDVAGILAQADIATVNLEGGLYGPPYGVDASVPPALLEALKKAGVDMVQLANSYTISKGTAGLASTVQGVQAAGLTPVGAYANAADAKAGKGYTLKEINGIKIAFVAFTKGMDGMALPAGSEGCVNLLYTDYATAYQKVDTAGIQKVLQAAEKAKPDITIALLHWGSEFNDTISATQEEIAELLLEGGVDGIIGTHSHYVQKMEYDPAKDTFIAYSLGDFLSDATRPGSEYSVILDLEITKNLDNGKTGITSFTTTPIFTVSNGETVRLARIDSAIAAYDSGYLNRISEEAYQSMKYALERIESRIKGE